MRRLVAVAAVAITLVSAGCGAQKEQQKEKQPASAPVKATTPKAVEGGAAPVMVTQEDCPEPPRTEDGFRAATVPASWKLLAVDKEPGSLSGGALASDGTLWALRGTRPETSEPVRWKDGSWQPVDLPPGVKAVNALATGPGGAIWAVEPGPGTWKGGIREGDTWREAELAVPADKEGFHASAQEGWASFGTTAVHWDGTAWTRVNLPTDQQLPEDYLPFPEYRLSGSGEQVWALPFQGSTAVRLRDGAADQVRFAMEIGKKEAIHDPQKGAFYPQAVAVVGPDDTWVLGAAAFGTHYLEEGEDTMAGRVVAVHLAQGRWSCTWGPFHRENFEARFADAVPDGAGGLWAVTAESTLWHLSEGRWTREKLPTAVGEATITDLVSRDGRLYALGSLATGEQSNGALWQIG